MLNPKHNDANTWCLYVLLCVAFLAFSQKATAQFLRLGPFEFNAQSYLDLIYTTNVEGERESEATDEREDAYLRLGIDLTSASTITPETDVDINLGIAIERHLNRKDLDNSSSPFAHSSIALSKTISRFRFDAAANYDRTADAEEDVVFVGGESGKTRRERDEYGYGAGVNWAGEALSLQAGYTESFERYLDEENFFADKNETAFNFGGNLKLTRRVSLAYSYDRNLTELINQPDDDPEWDITQQITLPITILEKPNLIYSFGYQKEDDDPWEYIHIFSIRDDYTLSPTLKLSGFASYTIEEIEDDDDIAFEFGGQLTHQISDTAEQSIAATREPANTFASSTETDNTTYSYRFKKSDLFIYGLTFAASVSYEIDKPLAADAEEETTWNYLASLSHSAQVTRRLARRVEYAYSREELSSNPEILDEHRITWSYIYDF